MAAPRRLALSCLALALAASGATAALPPVRLGSGKSPETAGQRRSLQAAPAEDIGADLWQTVLTACVRPATVDSMLINAFDYSILTAADADADADALATKAAFDQYIAFLANLPAGSVTDDATSMFTPAARKALLINAYNALIVKVIVEGFVFDGANAMRSIKDIGREPPFGTAVWNMPAGTIAGVSVTLDDIEKGIAGAAPLVGLLPSYSDPRIHSSIVCGSVSCPDLSMTAFTGGNVDWLLDDRVTAWLTHESKGLSIGGYSMDAALNGNGGITASKLFDWYRSDFDAYVPRNGEGLPSWTGFRGFLLMYAPAAIHATLASMPDSAFEQTAVGYFDYDWDINLAPLIVPIPWWGRTDGLTGAPRDDFSLFLLRTQWAPEWCCGSRRSYCAEPGLGGGDRAGVGNRLLIHGLWPQWNDAAGDRTAGETLRCLLLAAFQRSTCLC